MKTKYRIYDSRIKGFIPSYNEIMAAHERDNPDMAIYGDLLPYVITLDGLPVRAADCCMTLQDGDVFELNQFIGLQDKHGIDIYEGDIVRFDIRGHPHGFERETWTESVWYCVEDACWAIGRYTHEAWIAPSGSLIEPYTWWHTFQDDIDRGTLEVVGNIYQHTA